MGCVWSHQSNLIAWAAVVMVGALFVDCCGALAVDMLLLAVANQVFPGLDGIDVAIVAAVEVADVGVGVALEVGLPPGLPVSRLQPS